MNYRTLEVASWIKFGLLILVGVIFILSLGLDYLPGFIHDLVISLFRRYPVGVSASPVLLIFSSYIFAAMASNDEGGSPNPFGRNVFLKENSILGFCSSVTVLLGVLAAFLIVRIVQPYLLV